jgi:hypothetical protein
MDKPIPVNVANVTSTAGSNKPDRDDIVFLAILVDVLAPVKSRTVNQQPRPSGTRRLDNVGDEPFWEAPGCDSGSGR